MDKIKIDCLFNDVIKSWDEASLGSLFSDIYAMGYNDGNLENNSRENIVSLFPIMKTDVVEDLLDNINIQFENEFGDENDEEDEFTS